MLHDVHQLVDNFVGLLFGAGQVVYTVSLKELFFENSLLWPETRFWEHWEWTKTVKFGL